MKKVFIIIISIIVLLFVGFIAFSSYCKKINLKEQENIEQIIKGSGKKALVLYQDSLSSGIKDNVDLIVDKLKQSKYSITINHPRSDLKYEAKDYDLIVLITPVYVKGISKPLLEFADKQNFQGKKVLGVIRGKMKEDGEAEEMQSHIKNAQQAEIFKVTSDDNAKIIENLEKLL